MIYTLDQRVGGLPSLSAVALTLNDVSIDIGIGIDIGADVAIDVAIDIGIAVGIDTGMALTLPLISALP